MVSVPGEKFCSKCGYILKLRNNGYYRCARCEYKRDIELHPVGPDPRVVRSKAAFLEAVAKHKAKVVGEWTGSHNPIKLRCRNGHECSPRPNNMIRGCSPCHLCSKKSLWDVLYIVTSAEAFKFGVASGTAKRRLSDHARAGYTEVLRIYFALPEEAALGIERHIRKTLIEAGEAPLQGREYFSLFVVGTALDIVDSHPLLRGGE